jgi:hypothetical protein
METDGLDLVYTGFFSDMNRLWIFAIIILAAVFLFPVAAHANGEIPGLDWRDEAINALHRQVEELERQLESARQNPPAPPPAPPPPPPPKP